MRQFFSFTKEDIEKLGKSLKEKYRFFSPVKNEKNYLEWSEDEINIDFCGNTLMPIKNFFFPQFEKLFAFKGRKGKIEISEAGEEFQTTVFFGVRPCDMQSIQLLDKVFLSEGSVDKKYKEKREKSVFISFACTEPYETCFCTSTDLSFLKNEIADILFFKIDNDKYLGRISEKGLNLLEEFNEEINFKRQIASKEQIDELEELNRQFEDKFKINFDLNKELPGLKEFFYDDYFEDKAFKCLGCGICSYVCPTCHCFTIADNANKNEGYRMRCWDYCLNADFTLMAGGHNPRTEKGARLRQRFLHKGYYFPEKHNLLGCVGCGRCLAKCPVSMDICDGIKHVRGNKII